MNMQDAIQMHLEDLREDNQPIPEPSAAAEYVTIQLHEKGIDGSTGQAVASWLLPHTAHPNGRTSFWGMSAF